MQLWQNRRKINDKWEVDEEWYSASYAMMDLGTYLFLGSIKIKSETDFTLKREGNKILIKGKTTHSINDVYDFNDDLRGKTVFKPERILAKNGYAKPFPVVWKKSKQSQEALRLKMESISGLRLHGKMWVARLSNFSATFFSFGRFKWMYLFWISIIFYGVSICLSWGGGYIVPQSMAPHIFIPPTLSLLPSGLAAIVVAYHFGVSLRKKDWQQSAQYGLHIALIPALFMKAVLVGFVLPYIVLAIVYNIGIFIGVLEP